MESNQTNSNQPNFEKQPNGHNGYCNGQGNGHGYGPGYNMNGNGYGPSNGYGPMGNGQMGNGYGDDTDRGLAALCHLGLLLIIPAIMGKSPYVKRHLNVGLNVMLYSFGIALLGSVIAIVFTLLSTVAGVMMDSSAVIVISTVITGIFGLIMGAFSIGIFVLQVMNIIKGATGKDPILPFVKEFHFVG